MNKKVLYPILVLVIGAALSVLIAINKPAIDAEPYTPLAATVRVIKVEPGAEYLSISSQGAVQPRSESMLIPEVSGRVVWTSPSLVSGGVFAENEVLLRIDDADYRNAVTRSEAAFKRAEVEMEYARDELKRVQSLKDKQLASQQQLDNTRRASQVAEANLSESRAALEQANRDLSRTELLAPFDGLVRYEQVDDGQFVTRGQSIGTIYATDYLEVRLPIATDQLVYLGLPISTRGEIAEDIQPLVTVAADFGTARLLWQGQLVRMEAEIDERSRMVYGVARLRADSNPEGLLLPVGMFVQADIRGRAVEGVIRLPRSAMRDNNQVLVVDEEGRIHFRTVTILRLEHDEMLISDGLQAGELVSVSPMQTVVEGMRVVPALQPQP
jgi:RND family efflux transporter MFP subunit